MRTTHLLVWTGDIGSPGSPDLTVASPSKLAPHFEPLAVETSAPGSPTLSVFHPSSGEVRIELANFPGAMPPEVEVFDVRGRFVRRISGESGASRSLVWDGKDHRGGRVAAGVYLLRARVENEVLTVKTVMVR